MGRAQARPRDRPHGAPGRRGGACPIRRDQRAGDRGCREIGEARDRLLPPHRQLPGEDLRRRQDSRRLFQARRPADREGDADLAPDRPSDPSAVRRRLQARDAGGRHRAVPRHGERPRHRRHGRGLRRADALGPALPRPDRGRPRRPRQRRVRAQPDGRRDGRERARPRRRRHRRRRHDGGVGGQGAAPRSRCWRPSCSAIAASSR